MSFVKGFYQSKMLLQATLNERLIYRRSIDRDNLRQTYLDYTASQTLSEILLQHRGLQASDPRDHVYALIGISRDRSSSKLLLDYAKSISEVYKHVTQDSVEHYHDLKMICAG
jgi:hypothetical protein